MPKLECAGDDKYYRVERCMDVGVISERVCGVVCSNKDLGQTNRKTNKNQGPQTPLLFYYLEGRETSKGDCFCPPFHCLNHRGCEFTLVSWSPLLVLAELEAYFRASQPTQPLYFNPYSLSSSFIRVSIIGFQHALFPPHLANIRPRNLLARDATKLDAFKRR